MRDFIIRPRRSRRRRVTLVVLLVFLLPLLVFSIDMFGIQERMNVNLNFRLPWNAGKGLSVEGLLGENAELREKLLILEQNNRVDKQAAALLQEQLIDSQEEIFRLKKDLEFYQGIINIKGDENSPVIHGLRIKPLARARAYRLELILLHLTNTDRIFEGIMDIVVEGIQDRAEKRLPLNELSINRNQDYTIRFRNFQRFENNFTLPDDFEPQRVFVTLAPDDQEESGFEQVFDWPEADEREKEDVG